MNRAGCPSSFRGEVDAILAELQGTKRLVAGLLYSGLRLLEALQLRVRDIELERHEITVRSGKGGHDRMTLLAVAIRPELGRQLARVRARHDADVR